MKHVYELSLHEDPHVFRLNEMNPRAYFVPFEREETCALERENSAFFHGLNGPWKFLYCPSLYDMPGFFAEGFDDSGFETVSIPEVWQTHGADRAQATCLLNFQKSVYKRRMLVVQYILWQNAVATAICPVCR